MAGRGLAEQSLRSRPGDNAQLVRKGPRATKPTERRRVGQQVSLRSLSEGDVPEARAVDKQETGTEDDAIRLLTLGCED